MSQGRPRGGGLPPRTEPDRASRWAPGTGFSAGVWERFGVQAGLASWFHSRGVGPVDYLNEVPLAGLMFVVALGFGLGRLRVRGVGLGPAGGTVALGLVLGHFGLGRGPEAGAESTGLRTATVGLFGFCLFIYSVGFEAGPRFFSSLRERRGWRFVATGVVVNVVALAVVVSAGRALELDPSMVAGTLAGALTSAPTYAAASELAGNPARLAVGFAVAYPVGLIGLMLSLQLVGRWGNEEASNRRARIGRSRVRRRLEPQAGSPEVNRVFRVNEREVVGPTLRQLDLTGRTGCVIGWIRRGTGFLVPMADTELRKDDLLLVTGRVEELRAFEAMVGPETYDEALMSQPHPQRIQVTRPSVGGKTLSELDLIRRHHVVVRRIECGNLLIEPSAEASLHAGDIVELVGDPGGVRAAARELGRFEPASNYTDIAIYAGGILLGLLVGQLSLRPIGVDVSIGMAGGLLLCGVVLGRLRQIGPFSAHVPEPARQLVRDLGILLFVAERGLAAGRQLATHETYRVLESVAVAGATMMAALAVSLLFARWVLRLPLLDALGSVCGGMTSSSALAHLKRLSGGEPSVSYAASYAVASVLVTMAGQVVLWIS